MCSLHPLFQFTCLSDHPCTTNFTTKAVDPYHHGSVDPAAASASSSVPASHETYVPYPGDSVSSPPGVNYAHRKCALPQYISLSAAFSFLTVSIFLRYPRVTPLRMLESIFIFSFSP